MRDGKRRALSPDDRRTLIRRSRVNADAQLAINSRGAGTQAQLATGRLPQPTDFSFRLIYVTYDQATVNI